MATTSEPISKSSEIIHISKVNNPVATSAAPQHQVEVEPRLTEKREAELAIECPRDQPRNPKIADGVDSRCEHPC